MASTMQFRTVRQADETTSARAVHQHAGFDAIYLNAENHGVLDFPREHPPSSDHPNIYHGPTILGLFKRLKQHGVKVVLTANGGDETMCASNFLLLHRLLRSDLTDIINHCRSQQLSLSKHLYTLLLRPFIPGQARRMARRLSDQLSGRSTP